MAFKRLFFLKYFCLVAFLIFIPFFAAADENYGYAASTQNDHHQIKSTFSLIKATANLERTSYSFLFSPSKRTIAAINHLQIPYPFAFFATSFRQTFLKSQKNTVWHDRLTILSSIPHPPTA